MILVGWPLTKSVWIILIRWKIWPWGGRACFSLYMYILWKLSKSTCPRILRLDFSIIWHKCSLDDHLLRSLKLLRSFNDEHDHQGGHCQRIVCIKKERLKLWFLLNQVSILEPSWSSCCNAKTHNLLIHMSMLFFLIF